MKDYRFSPIKSIEELHEAIEYVHAKCFELCKNNFGSYLPVAGNIGIFCHFEDEYESLTRLREGLADESDNWNQKYYRLHEPITVQAKDDIPGATYTYLYIRKPDEHCEVGDIDFVLDSKKYDKLKGDLSSSLSTKGMEILDRVDLDLIKLFDPCVDVLAFIGKRDMVENVRMQYNSHTNSKVII